MAGAASGFHWPRLCACCSSGRASSPSALPARPREAVPVRRRHSWRSNGTCRTDELSCDETCSGTSEPSRSSLSLSGPVEWGEDNQYEPEVLSQCLGSSDDRRSCSFDSEPIPEDGADDPSLEVLMATLASEDPSDFVGGRVTDAEKRSLCRRLLQKYSGNLQMCAPRLKHALSFRVKHDNLFTKREYVLAGDYRVIGSDSTGRPVLYVCMKNQILPFASFRDQQVVTMLHAIDHLPNGAGSAIQILDLHGARMRLADMNPSPLVEWARSQENFFAGMMHEVIIIDMPRMASVLKEALWPLMPIGVKQKIKFMNLSQAMEYLESTCDSEVANRISDVMVQNRDPNSSLDERKRGWARVDRSGALIPMTAQS